MTVEMSVNGRPVYTLARLAQLTGQKQDALRQRVSRYKIEPAGHADDRTPVYYGDDPFMGIKRIMWTLETDLGEEEMDRLIGELSLGYLGISTAGRYTMVSAMGWTASPPPVLETIADALRDGPARHVGLRPAGM